MSKSIKEIVFKPSSKGEPLLIIKSDIVNEYLITNGFDICKANKFLGSLNTGIEVKFESFPQYCKLLKNIACKLNIPYIGI